MLFDPAFTSATVRTTIQDACYRLQQCLDLGYKALPITICRPDGRHIPASWAFDDIRSLNRRCLLVYAGDVMVQAIIVIGPASFVRECYSNYADMCPLEWIIVQVDKAEQFVPDSAARFIYNACKDVQGFTIASIPAVYTNALRSAQRRLKLPVTHRPVKLEFQLPHVVSVRLVDYASSLLHS